MFPTNPDLIRSNPVAFPTLGSGLSYGQQISLTISSIHTLNIIPNIIRTDFILYHVFIIFIISKHNTKYFVYIL